MTAVMTRDERTDALVAELDRLRQLKRLEDTLNDIRITQEQIAARLDAHDAQLKALIDAISGTPDIPDDDMCPTCDQPMAYYHGPGTDSGRICTYCDTDWTHGSDWGAA